MEFLIFESFLLATSSLANLNAFLRVVTVLRVPGTGPDWLYKYGAENGAF